MIKILITGKDSYIGKSFTNWISQWGNKYNVDTIDVRDSKWKNHDFSVYDVVLHVAAIVHHKEKNKDLYYKVNRDLAFEIAQKAKLSGIKYFILMSTMGVYGKNSGVIDNFSDTIPKTTYSKSKLEAELLISSLRTETFRVAILRPPLVYGYLCKGNYRALSAFAQKTPIFPKITNKRSMIYIDVLSNYIRLIIEKQVEGILLPQNIDYVDVSNLINMIRNVHNKKMKLTRLLNFVKFFKFVGIFEKVFCDFYYSSEMYSTSDWKLLEEANFIDFEQSIKKSEGLT